MIKRTLGISGNYLYCFIISGKNINNIKLFPVLLLILFSSLPVYLYGEILNPEERAYLRHIGSVKMCVDPDWTPYEYVGEKGEYEGIAADLIGLIAGRTGIQLELVRTADWNESIEFSKSGKCDILVFLNQTPQRDEWLLFTDPYFSDPNVLITRNEHDYISDLSRFSGEVIALPEGTSIEERIRNDYPELNILKTGSESEAFKMVEDGRAHMTLRSLTMAAYTIKKGGWFNLKISGDIPDYTNQMRIGVVKDKSLLRAIFNKGIETVTPEDVRIIVNRHVPITMDYRVDYKLIVKIAGGFFLLIGIGLIWVFQLRRLNRKLVLLSDQLQRDRDVRIKAEESLRESKERYQLLVETAQEGIFVLQNGNLVYHNPMLLTISGYSDEEISGKPFIDFVFKEDQSIAAVNHQKRLEGENIDQRYSIRAHHKSGEIIWLEISGTYLKWNGSPATLNFVTDITERIEIENEMKHMAQHDKLTNLPNRALFSDRLRQALASAQRNQNQIGVLFIDLDEFKPVNDTFGHDVGDRLLQKAARRIQKALRESDTAARIGGDEFVILLPVLGSPGSAEGVGNKIWQDLSRPYQIDGHQIEISASIGVAVFPVHGTTEIELLKNADEAMYRIKKSGRNGVAVCTPAT
ncbi:MAG: diguanylate cyclase [Spirochaetae bacterium HGW-Spirochaetae-5]|nr:MAG: diguanylate cyclase [Spirochaetae bacterium HGW-Spirochaetae-5]